MAVISAGACAIISAYCHGSLNDITQIQFEFGAITLLRQQCEGAGIRRPLIVTDRA